MTSAKRIQVEPNIFRYKTARGYRYGVRLEVECVPHRKFGFRNIDHARRYLKALFADTPETPESLTLREYWERWWPEWQIHLKRRTITDYKQKVETHILPELGDIPLLDITRARLKTLLLKLEKQKLSHTTIKHIVTPLSAMLSTAVDHELLATNPTLRLSRVLKLKKIRKPKVKAFRADEQTTILSTCQEDFPEWFPLVSTLFSSGVRYGEVVALEWEDVDLADKSLIISKNFTAGKLEETTKNGEPRIVPMTDALPLVLKGHLEMMALNASYKKGKLGPLVFPGVKGGYMHPSYFSKRVWKPILSKAKVRYLPPHSTRHSFVTRLLEKDVSLSKIQKLVGHASIQLTVDTYGHLLTVDVRNVMDK